MAGFLLPPASTPAASEFQKNVQTQFPGDAPHRGSGLTDLFSSATVRPACVISREMIIKHLIAKWMSLWMGCFVTVVVTCSAELIRNGNKKALHCGYWSTRIPINLFWSCRCSRTHILWPPVSCNHNTQGLSRRNFTCWRPNIVPMFIRSKVFFY